MTLFYCNRQVGSTEEICKHVTQQIKTYDIFMSTCYCMMDDLVGQGQHGGEMGKSNGQKHSLGSRCKLRLGEGTTDCQEPAPRAEMDNKRALLGTEEELSSNLNSWSSIHCDNSLCPMERKAKADSTVTTSSCETLELNNAIACIRWLLSSWPIPDKVIIMLFIIIDTYLQLHVYLLSTVCSNN